MSRKFDRFMVAVEISSNPKIGRLTDAEFRCLVAGVWPLAAKASIRGRLLIGPMKVEPRDLAHQARCSESVARNTLEKLRTLGMIEADPEFGCERVHDWNDVNPEPRRDITAAERQQRRRDKLRDAENVTHRDVTPVTLTKVEEKIEEEVEAPLPPAGELHVTPIIGVVAPVKPKGNRTRDLDQWSDQISEWTSEHFPGCEPDAVAQLVGWVRSRGIDPTPAAIREFAESAPNFAHLLEPAA